MSNCIDAEKGSAVCDNCNNGKPELCRYMNTAGAIKRIEELQAQLAEVRDYAAHKPYCTWFEGDRFVIRVCDCGLKAAIGEGCNHHYVATEFDPIPQCEHCGALIGEDES